MAKKREAPPTLSNDNALDNLSPGRVGIVSLLRQPHSVVDLARATKRKAPNICRDLKILEKQDLAEKDKGSWKLTNLGLSLLHYHGVDGYPEMIIPSNKGSPTEYHNLSFTLKLWSIPDNWDRLRRPGLMFGLGLAEDHPNYPKDLADNVTDVVWNEQIGGGSLNFHMGAYTVACQAPSVKIWLPTVIGESPEDGMIKAMNMLLHFTPKLERWLKLPATTLYSHGRLNVKVSSRHITLLKSVLGAAVLEVGDCNHLVIKAPDGSGGFIVDKSHGDGEIENINIGYGVDPSENLKDLETQLGAEGIKKALHQYAYGLAPLPAEQKAALDMIGAQVIDLNATVFNLQPVLNTFGEKIGELGEHMTSHINLIDKSAGITAAGIESAKSNAETAKTLNRALDRVDKIFKAKQDRGQQSSGFDLSAMKRARKNYLGRS